MANFDISKDNFVRVLILNKVTNLVRSSFATPQDQQDLIQDFYLRCIESLKHYDANMGHHYPFLVVVVNRHSSNIVRAKLIADRRTGRIKHLSELVSLAEGEPNDLAAMVEQGDQDRRLGAEHRLSEQELSDLAMDLKEAVSSLPPHLQELLQQLQTESLADVVRKSKPPQSTTYSRMHRIVRTFQEGSLKNYLEK